MTNGHAAPTSSNQSQIKDGVRGMSKSKSTPVFTASQASRVDTLTLSDSKSNQQYIEEILMRDFLEPVS